MAKKIVKKRSKKPVEQNEQIEQIAQMEEDFIATIEAKSEEVVTELKETPEEAVQETKEEPKPVEEKKSELPSIEVTEATINIASSTPSKDFAVSICKYFETHPNCTLRVRAIGAGATHQLLKATIEANKLLASRGKMIARYDFWTNENGKSVNNTRLIEADVYPHTLAQALNGKNVKYLKLEEFVMEHVNR